MSELTKYNTLTNEELNSLEAQVSRILKDHPNYNKDYLSEEILEIKAARRLSPQTRKKNREATDKKTSHTS